MRDLMLHHQQFQTLYNRERKKGINPKAITTRYGLKIEIPITLYDPKNLKRVMAEPIQEPCYTVRPMSKKQIFKVDRAGVMLDARSVERGGLNLDSDPNKIRVFKPYGKESPKERWGKALQWKFRQGTLLPGNMTIKEWHALKAMGENLE